MGGLQKWISSISVCDAKPKRQSTFVDNVCSPETKHRSFTVKQEKWTVEIEKLLMTQFSFILGSSCRFGRPIQVDKRATNFYSLARFFVFITLSKPLAVIETTILGVLNL